MIRPIMSPFIVNEFRLSCFANYGAVYHVSLLPTFATFKKNSENVKIDHI